MKDEGFLAGCLIGLLLRLLFSKIGLFIIAIILLISLYNSIDKVLVDKTVQQITEYFNDIELPDFLVTYLSDEDDPSDISDCKYITESSYAGDLRIGGQAVVQNTIDPGLACRECPGKENSRPEIYLRNNERVAITEGPVSVSQDPWFWWQVETQEQKVCWAAEENWLIYTVSQSCEPNDPDWIKQWNLKTIDLIKALEEFPDCSPNPVDVAIIDTGIDKEHIELVGRIFSSATLLGDDGSDINGHGTFIAGIIGANSNNNTGIAGIHPNVNLRIYKYINQDPDKVDRIKDFASEIIQARISNVALLIKKAVDEGAKVINISAGFPWDQHKISESVVAPCWLSMIDCDGELEQAVKYAEERGVIIVTASGNSGEDELLYPAAYASSYSNVIVVAASSPSGELWSNSSTGTHVTVSAPGGSKECQSHQDCIISTWNNGEYKIGNGTSFATPHVTGIVALIISANPNLRPFEIKEIIQTTASPYSKPPPREAGTGIVNAFEAVKAAKDQE